jgi:hypothetical protein
MGAKVQAEDNPNRMSFFMIRYASTLSVEFVKLAPCIAYENTPTGSALRGWRYFSLAIAKVSTGVFLMPSYVPINNELHQGKRWLRIPSYEFAKNEMVSAIFANELPDAIHSLPVAFIKHEDRFVLVAVMGLKPNENLLLTDTHQWLPGAYIPLNYRTRPFALLEMPNNREQQALCIDDSFLSDEVIGEALFNEDGKITKVVEDIFNLLTHYNSTRFLNEQITSALAESGIIVPWELNVNEGNTEHPLRGLFRIDEEALNTLSKEAFLTLREAAALPVVYAQLFSVNNIHHLSQLFVNKAKKLSDKNERNDGTFSFSGL